MFHAANSGVRIVIDFAGEGFGESRLAPFALQRGATAIALVLLFQARVANTRLVRRHGRPPINASSIRSIDERMVQR